MATFKGEYEHALDAKGRVSFPAKLRKSVSAEAQDSFTLLRGQEQCLHLYPRDRWEKVEAKLEEVNKFSREGRTVLRSFLRTAEDVTLDEQNRIALPKKLMEYAGITERCVFIGSGEYIEIWSPEVLERADSEIDNETLQALYEKVLGGRE